MGRTARLGVLIGLVVLILVDAIAVRLGLASGLPKLDNASLWLTSRAAGMTAYVALTLNVIFGLLVSTRAADRWIARASSISIHRWLSSVGLTLIAVHALALTGERLTHFDMLDALVPFLSSYRPFATGLGVLAAYAALLVHASFDLQRRIGARAWRKLHLLSFAVFALALAHGALAGTSSERVGARALYLISGAAVALLTLYRATFDRALGRPGVRHAARR
jgi:predicted ferric reductase